MNRLNNINRIFELHLIPQNLLESLISTKWLSEHIEDENLIILYTTLVPKKESIPTEIENLRIKGARFFDLQKVFSDQDSGLPNTFPKVKQFEEGCQKLGINKQSRIVVYDTLGIYSSPRVWFLFKCMGHENVFVLDGGFKAWLKDGFKVEEKQFIQFAKGNFLSRFKSDLLIDKKNVEATIDSGSTTIIDARSALRFYREVPEPREGLRSGHIPTSFNLHYAELHNNGKYKSLKALRAIFNEFESDKPIVFSCGSGITACILFLAASELLSNKL